MSVLVAVVHLAARDSLAVAYDLRPIARELKAYEDNGKPLANFGAYHGQYQFLGRLTTPMAELGLKREFTESYIARHPDAVVVAYYYLDEMPDFPEGATPLAAFRFRDYRVLFWRGSQLRAYPGLGNRT
jgi:hypothetical protein